MTLAITLFCFFDRVTRRAEFFDPVRISNISFHNNSVHQYTIKVHKKINNLKSRNFEDYFMRNHYKFKKILAFYFMLVYYM